MIAKKAIISPVFWPPYWIKNVKLDETYTVMLYQHKITFGWRVAHEYLIFEKIYKKNPNFTKFHVISAILERL